MSALEAREGRGDAFLEIEGLVCEFPVSGGQRLRAVAGVSFTVARGETLGLVGESGCGKSTTARAVMQLPPPTDGVIVLDGMELTQTQSEALRLARRRMQMIFQDPVSSLNPRRRVGDLVAAPLRVWNVPEPQERVRRLLGLVGLDFDAVAHRYPHELSGGQCQRVCIARALALEPELLICDEPVSALDVSIQAQVLNVLEDMKAEFGLTMLFVSHDLGVVKSVTDRVAVMYLGKICEIGRTDDVYDAPLHPYTRALLDAVPVPDPEIEARKQPSIRGELPSPLDPPSGCRFRTRCPKAQQRCAIEEPVPVELRPGHFVACHFPLTRDENERSVTATRTSEEIT